MTDQETKLLRACLNGEKASWDTFVQQYSGLVFYTIKKTLSFYHVEPKADIVEDLFQEFFLSLMRDGFRKLRQFRAERGTRLASWLRLIVARQVIDFLRKPKNTTGDDMEIQAPDSADPSTSLLNQEQNKLLFQSLENLRPRDLLFVELYFYQCLPPEEIAKTLRVSISAVYTQKCRILGKLRGTLQKMAAS